MLGLYDEQTNWLSQVKLYSGTKGLLDMHKFTKLLKLFSARLGCIKQVDIHVSLNIDFELIKTNPSIPYIPTQVD